MSTSLVSECKTLSRKRDIVAALNHHFVSAGPTLVDQIEQNSNDGPLKRIAQEESLASLLPLRATMLVKPFNSIKMARQLWLAKSP